MKENNVPGLPGGIWSTGRRGSLKIAETAQRNAARDAVRLGAPNPPHQTTRGLSTPSPAASDSMAALPFAIPLQPTTKTGRSLSHSQGQREAPQTSGATAGGTAAALPLGLLAEEDDADTESEPDMGSGLTHTTSHPPIGIAPLMRTATLPATYESRSGGSNGRDFHLDNTSPTRLLRGRTFEAAFANLSIGEPDRYHVLYSHSHLAAIDHSHRRAQWQSSLGWDDVPNVNESRRHSLADIPTRRGSLAAGEPSMLSRTYTHEVFEGESPTNSHPPRKSQSDITFRPVLRAPGSMIHRCCTYPAIGYPRSLIIHLDNSGITTNLISRCFITFPFPSSQRQTFCAPPP
jgi:hypothetical protein